jgi:hypothetical protein
LLACLTFDVEGLQAHPKKAVESFHAAFPRGGRTLTGTADPGTGTHRARLE